MSKNLLNLCKKIGLFKLDESKKVLYGPYGQAILLEIKNLWLKSILNKNENIYLINQRSVDADYYVESLMSQFNKNLTTFGLIDVHDSENEMMFVDDNEANYKYNFNFHQFLMEKDKYNDKLVYWSHQRKMFWFKLFSMPENIALNVNDYQMKLNYKYEAEGVEKCLEKISCFSNDEFKKYMDERPLPSSFLSKMRLNFEKLISIQTNSELILESLLIDSIRTRILSGKKVFHLDFRIAPYKACVLVKSSSNESQQISNDLLNSLFKANINVFRHEYRDDEQLEELFERFDELGIPFIILLPVDLKKNGICYLRNRDTTIQEHLHFTQLIDQFKFLMASFDEI